MKTSSNAWDHVSVSDFASASPNDAQRTFVDLQPATARSNASMVLDVFQRQPVRRSQTFPVDAADWSIFGKVAAGTLALCEYGRVEFKMGVLTAIFAGMLAVHGRHDPRVQRLWEALQRRR